MKEGSEADTMERAVNEYISKEAVTNADLLPLGNNAELIESGILDSVSLLKLVLFLEQRFGISVGMEEVIPRNFDTVEKICGFVRSKEKP